MALADETELLEVTKSIDCSGKCCPMPIYMATRTLAAMAAGEVLEVKCTDASSVHDFPAFVEKAGHTLLASERREGKVTVFLVRKGEGAEG